MIRNVQKEDLATPKSATRTPVRPASYSRRFGDRNVPSDGSPYLEQSSSRPTSANNVRLNDDEEEKRQRRHNNMINKANVISPGCHTPRSVQANRSRPVEAVTSSLTNSQLSEHYADCIKLSTQNKITAKNAFGLHLIDHMLSMLKQRGDITNFQVASSTLDAGAKIYAGRVDSIYNDAFKVLGGLGTRDQNSKEKDENKEGQNEEGKDEEEGQEAGSSRPKGHKGKKAGSAATLEADPSVLDIASFDTDFRADPLFRKTAAAFDEGGVSGLLLKNIPIRDDTCMLQLDSSHPLILQDQPSLGMTLDMDKDLLDLSALDSRQICPTFANYNFMDSSAVAEGEDSSYICGEEGLAEDFGGVAPDSGEDGGMDPIQLADFTMVDAPPISSQDAGVDYDDGDAREDEAAAPGQGELSVLGIVNDNQVARFNPESGNEKSSKPLGELCLTDVIDPSDYSYFTSAVLESWAGPHHWKFRPKNMLSKTATAAEEEKVKAPRKRKAAPFVVDFSKINKIKKSQPASSKTSSRLSKAALKKRDAALNNLPQDTHTDVDVFHRLFGQSKWKVKRQKMSSGVIEEDFEGDWYNFGNANDQLNYCPATEDLSGDDSDTCGGDGMDDTALGFFNSSSQGLGDTLLPERGDSQPPSQQGELEGDNLLNQPHKVEKIRINYAKTAKKIDVKRLKTRMWDFISHPQVDDESQGMAAESDDKEDDNKSNSSEAGTKDSSADCVEFSSLCSHLPSLISSSMAKNVTVPMCFVCLLHLANEKELKLSSLSEDLSDFSIMT